MDLVSVYVTAPDAEIAKRLARSLLEKRLVACANLIPITSLYRWEGKIQEEGETAMFLKTTRDRVAEIERVLAAEHPYDVPCVVAFELGAGAPKYADWVHKETKAETAR